MQLQITLSKVTTRNYESGRYSFLILSFLARPLSTPLPGPRPLPLPLPNPISSKIFSFFHSREIYRGEYRLYKAKNALNS